LRVVKPIAILLLSAALSLPAAANLRMARKADGTFSGSLKAVAAAAKLRLIAEQLEAVFPELDLSNTDYRSLVRFRVVYEIENRGAGPAAVPLRFLAVDIRDLVVELNGRAVPAAIREAPEEKAECLIRMARYRSGFLPGFYADFLRRLRAGAGLDQEPDDLWIQKLGERSANLPPWSAALARTLEESEEKEPATADFQIALPPGRSKLVVTYGQRLFIDERGHGYFGVWPKKGVTGFDYLLYPAKSWEMEAGFKLRVSVLVPDARAKKFFVRTWRRAEVKCNLPLKESAGGKERIRVFEGEFKGGMPADVLTFLLWFDKNAAAYVR
jgi:hypothetical protein